MPLKNSVRANTLLHITTVPQTFGFIVRQMLFMKQLGWTVHAIASAGNFGGVLESEGVPFYPVTMLRRISPFRDLWAIALLWRLIQRIRPVVVHAHTPKAGLLGMMAATLAGVPVRVFHVHGLPHLTARGMKRRLLVLATRTACKLAGRVICVSVSIRQVLIDQHLCPAGKVVVPAHGSSGGVDARELFNPSRISAETVALVRANYRIPNDALVAAFVGRLVRDKGLIELCQSWKLLREAHPNLYLLIAGDFEPQDPVPEHVINIFRTDPRVRMVGHCSNMPEFFAASDLVVFPSYREGFPNVPLEASAMALPVVATAIPGCCDAVMDGETGTLVPPHDAIALAGAIERYIRDPQIRIAHGGRGRERALRDFRSEPIWEFISAQYGELLSRRGFSQPPQNSAADLAAEEAGSCVQ